MNISIVLLSHNLADIGYIILGGHKVSQIVELQDVKTARDDGLTLSFDGHYMVGILRTAQVF